MVHEDGRDKVISWSCQSYPHSCATCSTSADTCTHTSNRFGAIPDLSTGTYLPDSAIPVERIVCVDTDPCQNGQDGAVDENTKNERNPHGILEKSCTVLLEDDTQSLSDTNLCVEERDDSVSLPANMCQFVGKEDGTLSSSSDSSDTKKSAATYKVIPRATKKGCSMLVDSFGFSYVKNESSRGRTNKTYWVCTNRRKASMCRATIIQKGSIFTPGRSSHIHEGRPGMCKTLEITAEVKKQAQKDFFKPAAIIVKEVMTEKFGNESTDCNLPDVSQLTRVAHRIQQSDLETEHNDIRFNLPVDVIPANFLKADICISNARHILLFTAEQQALLDKAKILYMDRSTKMIRKPFCHIFSIHTYVKNDKDEYKQIPLAFCLMSRDRKIDYKMVLTAINEAIPSSGKNTKVVVVDFVVNLWKAIRLEYGNQVMIRGCVSYWTQAIWEKCLHYGLQESFIKNKTICRQIRQLMALPFLPADYVVPIFMDLRPQAVKQPSLLNLFQYIENTWIFGYWKPEDWSGYNCSIRTKSDIEYWHRQVNHKVSRAGGVQLYRLFALIFQIASGVQGQLKVVKESKLSEYQKKQYRQIQAKVFGWWEKYDQGHISVLQLLDECSQLNGPSP